MDYQPKIKIVTVATKESGYLKWLKESCLTNGSELLILGNNVEWKGYVTKFEIVNEFLLNQDERDIFCFIDAYDVIMLKNIEELKRDFINSGHRIICSVSEREKCGIKQIDDFVQKIVDKGFSVGEGCAHINPGAYIGYCKELRFLLNSTMEMNLKTGEIDDEKLLNQFNQDNQGLIYPDSECDFFKTVSPFTEFFDREDYGQHSYFIHRIANMSLINFLEKRGYVITFEEKIKLFNESIIFLFKKIPYHVDRMISSNIN